MGEEPSGKNTQLLQAWSNGDRAAFDELMPRVYAELRRIAGHHVRNEQPGRSIQTTALVHEAYLKLIEVTNVDWRHRAHFFAISSQIMRRILLDRARRRTAGKRGGKSPAINLDEVPDLASGRSGEVIALDEALTRLAQVDARKAQVIELRFFGGLTVDDTAVVLKISPETVLRDWKFARAWLLKELGSEK